jgi:methylglutaconyl-CoA hydratase
LKFIKVVEDGFKFHISLNRPEIRNAFSEAMISEITECFQKLALRTDVRVVTLQGEGTVFCAGADLNWMKKMASFSYEENEKDAGLLFDMFKAIEDCPLPLVTCVQGAVFGGGLGLLAVSDFVVAEAGTQFCFSETRLGLAPAVIGGFVLRRCAKSQVAPFMISAQTFNSKTALRMGLVHQIANQSEITAQFEKLCSSLATLGPQATVATKKLIQQLSESEFFKHRKISSQCIAERRASAEGQEGLQAFFENRQPSWSAK